MKAIQISNRKARGIIKAILTFALFITVAVFMSSGALAASLPDRNGFDDNTAIKKQGYTISIPTYWESDIDEASEYRAYCNDDAFAMIIIDIYDEMTGVSFKDDKQRDLFVNSVITEIDSSGKLQDSSYKKFGNLEGAYSVFTFSN